MSLGYDQIQIYPFELVELEQLTLTKKINEHTRLYFTGIIPEDMQDSYVECGNNGKEHRHSGEPTG
jgi:hypothetical protein